jgi:hypothetical protein
MVKSNVEDAKAAVSLFKRSDAQGDVVTLSESNIAGMQMAVDVSNVLVADSLLLEESIKSQADKFVALAEAIEQRDESDASDFSCATRRIF